MPVKKSVNKKKVEKKSVKVNVSTSKKIKKTTANKGKKDALNLPKIAVVGIGGSGNNAANYMIKKDVRGVKFIAVNTDVQDLNQSKAGKKIKIGVNLTQGAGAGMDPEIGRKAALESEDKIADALKDVQMIFLTGGMGGGTGTGSMPIIASIAKGLGILTIAVVTKPFSFEGKKRMDLANKGISELAKNVDSYIVIENNKILETSGEDASLEEAFALSDEILRQGVEGISELIVKPGIINIDYADIKSVLENSNLSLIGIGSAKGESRALKAAEAAIHSPLIETSTKGAKTILFSISTAGDLKMSEISEIANYITEEASPEALIKFGTARSNKLKKGELKITVVASNFENNSDSVDYSEVKSFGLEVKKERKNNIEEKTLKELPNEDKLKNKDDSLTGWLKSFFGKD